MFRYKARKKRTARRMKTYVEQCGLQRNAVDERFSTSRYGYIMCIGFPGKIISIDKDNYAVIDISGTRREVCLDIVDEEVAVGDYVITHAGYAIHKIDVESAKEKLSALQELIDHEIY